MEAQETSGKQTNKQKGKLKILKSKKEIIQSIFW